MDALERRARKNGQREHVTLAQLEQWLGSDNSDYSHMAELALDIINGVYQVPHLLDDIEASREDNA